MELWDETVAVGKKFPELFEIRHVQYPAYRDCEPEPGAKSREACISKNIIVSLNLDIEIN